MKNCAKNASLLCLLKCNIDETGDLKTSCRTRDIIIQRNLTLYIFVVYPNSLSFCLFAFIITFLHSSACFFLSNSLSFVFISQISSDFICHLLSSQRDFLLFTTPQTICWCFFFFRVFPTSILRINIQLRFQRCCGWFGYQKSCRKSCEKKYRKIKKQMKNTNNLWIPDLMVNK